LRGWEQRRTPFTLPATCAPREPAAQQRHLHLPERRRDSRPLDRTHLALGNLGKISNVIDDTGGPAALHPRSTPKVAEFPAPADEPGQRK
jgi:hypothetical protein